MKAAPYKDVIHEKILPFHDEDPLKDLSRRLLLDQFFGRKIVLTNGCFDIFHKGHAEYLACAKELGNIYDAGGNLVKEGRLMVAVNSDESVRQLKGNDRPLNTAEARAYVVASHCAVDYVTIFNGSDLSELLEDMSDVIWVKGGDYNRSTVNQKELSLVESRGGRLEIIPFTQGYSTTILIEKVKGTAA